jgi:hypothetical protein
MDSIKVDGKVIISVGSREVRVMEMNSDTNPTTSLQEIGQKAFTDAWEYRTNLVKSTASGTKKYYVVVSYKSYNVTPAKMCIEAYLPESPAKYGSS